MGSETTSITAMVPMQAGTNEKGKIYSTSRQQSQLFAIVAAPLAAPVDHPHGGLHMGAALCVPLLPWQVKVNGLCDGKCQCPSNPPLITP